MSIIAKILIVLLSIDLVSARSLENKQESNSTIVKDAKKITIGSKNTIVSNQYDFKSINYMQNKSYKDEIENDLKKKIDILLGQIIDDDSFKSVVTIELVFKKEDSYENIYEPNGTIRSIQNINYNAKSSNTKNTTKHLENREYYEITKKTVNKREDSYGAISRVTSSVVFNKEVLKNIKNPEKFIRDLNLVVKDAIGYKEKRGDSITIKSFWFKN
ncbi:MAG: flagellar M-ring protein FliF C-terminal domain-containing protein [Campylobacterota bacterium]|nr:flagellar M-ring protein FliF C-terminal domain-containing protein [Campylobacterota bacterium]